MAAKTRQFDYENMLNRMLERKPTLKADKALPEKPFQVIPPI
jgi:hypothetical protein